jgi:hypothetical protein
LWLKYWPGWKGWMTLNLTIKKEKGGGGAVDWIYLAQNRVKLRTFAKALKKFLFSYNAGTFLTDRGHFAFPIKILFHLTSEYNVQTYLTKQGVSVLPTLNNACLECLGETLMIIPVFSDMTSFRSVQRSQNFGKVYCFVMVGPTVNPKETSRCDIREVQHRGLE